MQHPPPTAPARIQLRLSGSASQGPIPCPALRDKAQRVPSGTWDHPSGGFDLGTAPGHQHKASHFRPGSSASPRPTRGSSRHSPRRDRCAGLGHGDQRSLARGGLGGGTLRGASASEACSDTGLSRDAPVFYAPSDPPAYLPVCSRRCSPKLRSHDRQPHFRLERAAAGAHGHVTRRRFPGSGGDVRAPVCVRKAPGSRDRNGLGALGNPRLIQRWTFGRYILKYLYEKMVQLINHHDLPGGYEILPQVYEDCLTVLLSSPSPSGIIPPQSTTHTPLALET
ncbi:Hydrocephalus-inducing protein [Pteropus alecto]|uniref:Hydrocephalus-inducing protein n=1 Tax=Pteropus alecto TaxID=9402 RepID=L5K5M2_PTEAL|nr:Hydrocephalus-inducing protein [Pteropus alecto]